MYNQPRVFQARLFDEPQLASLCLENIDKNTGDALAAEGFTDIDLGIVVHSRFCGSLFILKCILEMLMAMFLCIITSLFLLFTLSYLCLSFFSPSVFLSYSLIPFCSLSIFLPPLSDTLVAVLERDTLGVREVRLFVAAVRWAEAEAHRQQLQPTPENKRRVLGKALALIRFPLMTIEEFAAGNTHTFLHY